MTSVDAPPALPQIGRLVHLLRTLLGFGFTRLLAGALARVPGAIGRLPGLMPPAQRFRSLLERLGGTFIKLGQVLSLQPDLVPREHCDELFDLLDRVPAFGYEEVEETFREDLGRRPDEIFESFAESPFASASIGQVHRARLDGRELAVKVRRPTAVRDFGGDIRLMRAAMWLLSKLQVRKAEGFRRPLREFIAWTIDELDYRNEARYMEQVRVNTPPSSAARVPKVLRELSTERILVVEYLEGTTLLEYMRGCDRDDIAQARRLERLGFEPEKFAESIVANFLGDVFRHGLFHADLHPANLLILPDNVVGYVDFGITGMISEYSRDHVLALILALARHDAEGMVEGLLAISEITEESDVDEFSRGVRDLTEQWFAPAGGVSKLQKSYTLIMLDLIRLSRRCSVLPHEEALRYMRSVITIDGLIKRFSPGYDVDAALERFSREHLQDRAVATSFSLDQMIESWIAGARLMRDGVARLDRLLGRLERKADGKRRRKRRGRRAERRVLALRTGRLAAFTVAVVALLLVGPPVGGLGLNVASAELALAGAGILALLWSGGQWIRAR